MFLAFCFSGLPVQHPAGNNCGIPLADLGAEQLQRWKTDMYFLDPQRVRVAHCALWVWVHSWKRCGPWLKSFEHQGAFSARAKANARKRAPGFVSLPALKFLGCFRAKRHCWCLPTCSVSGLPQKVKECRSETWSESLLELWGLLSALEPVASYLHAL